MAAKRKKPDESQGRIAWDTAEVTEGELVVELDGDVSKDWSKRVAELVDRLAQSSHWGAIEVTREKLTVAEVAEGHEDDLRHVLEGAVLQANADFAPEPDEDDGGSGASPGDQSMTAAFRAFADDAGDDDDSDDA
jgi:hypothetical protein